jgi:hypothetical protein
VPGAVPLWKRVFFSLTPRCFSSACSLLYLSSSARAPAGLTHANMAAAVGAADSLREGSTPRFKMRGEPVVEAPPEGEWFGSRLVRNSIYKQRGGSIEHVAGDVSECPFPTHCGHSPCYR